MAKSQRIIFCGSGEFGIPSLRRLVTDGHEIVQVFTQPDRPAGRGRKLTPTPLASAAMEMGLAVTPTGDINAEKLTDADLTIVIAFAQKIAPQVADHARLGSVNLHSSRLPKYRGAAPINWAIINGDPISGNSVIRLAQKMDAGAILGQSEIPIGPLETAGELHDRLAEDGAILLAKVVTDLTNGTATETPQDDAQATRAPKLSRESSHLDFTRPAATLANQIRGMYPWPGCHAHLCDAQGAPAARVTLCRAQATAGEGPRWHPGEIMTCGALSIGDGSEALQIIEIQPEGKRPMSLQAYRNGHVWVAGMRVVSC